MCYHAHAFVCRAIEVLTGLTLAPIRVVVCHCQPHHHQIQPSLLFVFFFPAELFTCGCQPQVFLLALLIALLFSVIPLWLFSCCRDPSQPRHLGQTIALFPLVVYEPIPPPPFPQIVVLSRGHPSWYSSKSTRTTTLMRLERQGVPDAAVVFWNLVDLCSANERVCSKLGRNTGDCTESYLATRPRVDQLSVLLPVDGGEICSGQNPRNWSEMLPLPPHCTSISHRLSSAARLADNHQSHPDNIC